MEYFGFPYRISAGDDFLIWVCDDKNGKKDHFVTDESGKIPTFPSLSDLSDFATHRGLPLTTSELHPLELDTIKGWLSNGAEMPECNELLSAWNAFSDVSASFPQSETAFAELNFTNKPIYEKLFWGSNLPAVTPAGERYDPVWSPAEIESLAAILSAGLHLFLSSTVRRTQQPLRFPNTF